MNETVKRIVDILFQDTVENDETRALHEELMNNCQEHYQDLVNRGLSEDEAVREVLLDQPMSVETSHFRNSEYADASEGLGCYGKNLTFCNICAENIISC